MTRKTVLHVLLAIGLLAALTVAVRRAGIEARQNSVQIVVDYQEVVSLAATTGSTPLEVMRQMKAAGASAVAVTSDTIAQLTSDGVLRPIPNSSGPVAGIVAPGDDAMRIWKNLLDALPLLDSKIVAPPKESKEWWITINLHGAPLSSLDTAPVGLPPTAIDQARAAGMEVVARIPNYDGASPKSASLILRRLKSLGVKTVIFQGDQVLGFRGSEDGVAQAFRDTGLEFGKVEFSKQKGEEKLAGKLLGSVLVVHSISSAEMPALSETTIVERFAKAVKERGVRVCYLRMYFRTSDGLVAANCGFVKKISDGIIKAGYSLGEPSGISGTPTNAILRALSGIGVAAGVMLLLLCLLELSGAAFWGWLTLFIVGCAGLSGMGGTGAKLVAFGSSVTFPTLAAFWAILPLSASASGYKLWPVIGRFLLGVATAAAGGLIIVGLLSEPKFFLRIDQFMGVKLAQLAPILILAVVFTGGVAWERAGLREQFRRLLEGLRNIGANPVLLWHAVGIVIVVGILGLMVARSGNDAGIGVSSLELKFRSILDKIMYVRPRTKEFMLGYPALMLGLAFALRGKRNWAALLVTFGTIGLVSNLNTWCHLHTPVALSAMRVVNGAIAGGALGLVLCRVFRRWIER